jgi:hypothetical protein
MADTLTQSSAVQSPQAPPQAPPTATPPSDPAEQILRSTPGLDTNSQADAWDAFHQSKNEDELGQRLQNMNLPQDIKANLWDAKHKAAQMVTNTAGETMPADVATRHALTRGQAPEQPQDARAGIAIGMGKEATKTVSGIGNLINKMLPSSLELPTTESEISKVLPEGPERQKQLADARTDLQPQTTAESVGGFAENILEFAGGEEALKGLSLAAKLGKLTKVAQFLEANPRLAQAAHIGGNILRSGTVGAALRSGTVGAAQGAAKGASEGDATGGAVGGGIGGVVGGATGEVFAGLGKGVQAIKNLMARNPELAEQGAAIVRGLTDDATPEQIARTVAKNLDDAEGAMRSRYDAGFKAVSNVAKDVPVNIAGSPLQDAATNLLGESSRLPESMSEGLKGVAPEMEKIEPLLDSLAKSNEVFTWDQLEATRQKIGRAFRGVPYDSPLRRPLDTLRSAIDDTMEKTASDAQRPELAQQIKSVRADYAKNVNALDQTAIVALRDKNPNEVANILMNKTSVHNINTLRSLIGPENMKPVQGSVLQNIINFASKNGPLDGPMLLRKFNSLGDDAKQALWGNNLPQIQKFVTEAAKKPSYLQGIISKVLTKSMLGAGVVGYSGYQLSHGDVKGAGKTIGLAALGYALTDPAKLDLITKALEAIGKGAPAIVGGAAQASGAAQAIGSLRESQNSGSTKVAEDTSDWRHIQASDGNHYMIHPEDLQEAKKRDPSLKVLQ